MNKKQEKKELKKMEKELKGIKGYGSPEPNPNIGMELVMTNPAIFRNELGILYKLKQHEEEEFVLKKMEVEGCKKKNLATKKH